MARYSDELLNNIKQEVPLTQLMEVQGYEVKKHGQQFAISCPWHDDKTPSLIITPTTNLWHCKHCDIGGSNIDWIMKAQGVSFRFACEILNKDTSALENTSGTVIKQNTVTKITSSLAANNDNQALLRQVVDYYHDALKQSEEAQAYLQSRGLNDPELIQHFKLGYANRTLGYRLPEKNRKAGTEVRSQLQEIGILRDSGHEHFNGSVIVPIINDESNICEIYGRKILGKRLRKGTIQHLYLPGPHEGVWNITALAATKEIILCEALLDAMTFWVHGFRNVTTSYGTSGFTSDHLAAFKEYGIERVLIAYDRDEAGNQAAEKLANKLMKEGISCFRILLPKGMDVNAYALQVTPAKKSLGLVIRQAEPMGDDLIMHDTPAIPPSENNTKPEPSAPLTATVQPPKPIELPTPETHEHETIIRFGERRYRIRGIQKNSSYEVLKVNILLQISDAIHVDTFDLYSAKHRQQFARVSATELSIEEKVIQRDLGQLLLQLETLQDQAIQEALKPKEPLAYTLTEQERAEALTLLNDPDLTTRITHDFAHIGLVGEPTNALMGYLAAVSRKLANPLAIIVQSTSAAGKSALMDAVLKLIPEEERVHYSAMTGQSLFYLGETNLKHKILGIAEEEGVRQAAYALKLLQSQGELTIASTGKDPQSGKLITEEYRVEGPVMLFLTTTAIDIDEELLNRCVVLTINESREQTAAIQQRQRQARTLSGLLTNSQSERVIQQHQNAQRLLRPLSVVNPYAEQLSFADQRTRTRRDHEKYLTLIDTIALLHQYQREIKTLNNNNEVIEYIEVTPNDIRLANELAHDILGRSLDELPPPTRRVLSSLYTYVHEQIEKEHLRQSEVRFTRRDVRQATGLSDKQARVHLERLIELEYLCVHGGRNGQRYLYELVFDGDPNEECAQLIGLIDVLSTDTMSNLVAKPADLVVKKSNLVAC